MSSIDLYTIGYQGRSVDDLIETLQSRGVETVVDVRELPLSRKREFSKSRLSEVLQLAGIRYISIRELGSPRALRHEYDETRDWDLFTEKFQSFLQTRSGELDSLFQRAHQETICLLCFERESGLCHRSIVAEALKKRAGNSLRIRHL